MRQPVHRNVIPPLDGIGYIRGSTSTVGHLSRSYVSFHFCWTTSFSSDVFMLSWDPWLVNMIFCRRPDNRKAVFGLQVSRGETAHRQPVQELERKLPRGVMAAGQLENLVRQLQFPKAP